MLRRRVRLRGIRSGTVFLPRDDSVTNSAHACHAWPPAFRQRLDKLL